MCDALAKCVAHLLTIRHWHHLMVPKIIILFMPIGTDQRPNFVPIDVI